MSDERKPGPALDAEIAERVFGEVEAHAPCDDGLTRTGIVSGTSLADCDAALRHKYRHEIAKGLAFWPAEYCGPNYSEDIAAAFLVVEKMREHPLYFELREAGELRFGAGDPVRRETDYGARFVGTLHPCGFVNAATPAHAICLAALDAIERLAALPEGQPHG